MGFGKMRWWMSLIWLSQGVCGTEGAIGASQIYVQHGHHNLTENGAFFLLLL